MFNTVNASLYHYAGNNPVKYTDPDGRLQRDAQGNLIFQKNGSPIVVQHPSGPSSTVQPGYLYTNDGKSVEAFINKDVYHNPGFNTDCHGTTFADGEYWINDNQVDKILSGDNYKKVDTPKKGDVCVFRDSKGAVCHSVTVEKVTKEHSFLGLFQWEKVVDVQVKGLGGLETETKVQNVNDAWNDKNATIEYYRKEN